ncbi:CheW protein [Stanieria cyanosphaera PCC 7437]|uniref:CheW protein n=1 Tax=Stanieria cyanosphaera (strain ATCC 29371 / PCC 7437) TaxID=111780 RepID=K9XZD4_STAC7|nr:chemotaxis protein CheW [Stanieria cyanosphaera]AFZ37888.1 CheW protein [Stanieria cyanosphaera PCC 7437]
MSDFTSNQNLLFSDSEAMPHQAKQQQFLKFYLEPDTKIMLPVEQITEVLKIDLIQIIPIPEMPAWVMGVHNWRGEILWMLDLGNLIGLNAWYEQENTTPNCTAIVLSTKTTEQIKEQQSEKTSLGLVVTRVEDIEWCNPDLVQSPPGAAITTEIAPFLRGYWLREDGEMILTLDGNAILAAMFKI